MDLHIASETTKRKEICQIYSNNNEIEHSSTRRRKKLIIQITVSKNICLTTKTH